MGPIASGSFSFSNNIPSRRVSNAGTVSIETTGKTTTKGLPNGNIKLEYRDNTGLNNGTTSINMEEFMVKTCEDRTNGNVSSFVCSPNIPIYNLTHDEQDLIEKKLQNALTGALETENTIDDGIAIEALKLWQIAMKAS